MRSRSSPGLPMSNQGPVNSNLQTCSPAAIKSKHEIREVELTLRKCATAVGE